MLNTGRFNHFDSKAGKRWGKVGYLPTEENNFDVDEREVERIQKRLKARDVFCKKEVFPLLKQLYQSAKKLIEEERELPSKWNVQWDYEWFNPIENVIKNLNSELKGSYYTYDKVVFEQGTKRFVEFVRDYLKENLEQSEEKDWLMNRFQKLRLEQTSN